MTTTRWRWILGLAIAPLAAPASFLLLLNVRGVLEGDTSVSLSDSLIMLLFGAPFAYFFAAVAALPLLVLERRGLLRLWHFLLLGASGGLAIAFLIASPRVSFMRDVQITVPAGIASALLLWAIVRPRHQAPGRGLPDA